MAAKPQFLRYRGTWARSKISRRRSSELSPEDLAKFRAWFEEFEERRFDERIARDAKAGKIDKLLAGARANHEAGRREDF